MAVTIKSKKEIELMREAGKMLEEVHNKLADFVKPGISTLETSLERKRSEILDVYQTS